MFAPDRYEMNSNFSVDFHWFLKCLFIAIIQQILVLFKIIGTICIINLYDADLPTLTQETMYPRPYKISFWFPVTASITIGYRITKDFIFYFTWFDLIPLALQIGSLVLGTFIMSFILKKIFICPIWKSFSTIKSCF